MYKRIIFIAILIINVLFVIKDIVLYKTINIFTIYMMLILLMIALVIMFDEKKNKIICIVIFTLLFISTITLSMYTYSMFGTEQVISAIQGYINVVYQNEPYYMVPIPNASYLSSDIGKIFISQKISDEKDLSVVLKDYYLYKKIIEIENLKAFDHTQLYKVKWSDGITFFLYVHEKDEYSWFKTIM